MHSSTDDSKAASVPSYMVALMNRSIFLIFLLFPLLVPMIAPPAVHSQGQTPLDSIRTAYRRFDYDSVVALSLRALRSDPPPPQEDKVEIYTYLAYAHIALGRTDEARQDFQSALELDPNLSFDPDDVSPKIIAIFEEVRASLEAREAERRRVFTESTLRDKTLKSEAAWRSLILPGWGQWHKGQKGKAYALFAVHAVNISTLLYAHIEMKNAHDEYLAAREPAAINSTYDRYNRFYKLRNYVILSTAAVWLYAHVDAVFSRPGPERADQASLQTGMLVPYLSMHSIGLSYTIHF